MPRAGQILDHIKGCVEQHVGGPARTQVVLLLATILGLDTADKGTLAAIAPGLKDAFGIGNTEIGILVAASSFMGAALVLPIGSLVDRIERKRILLIAMALWVAAMVVSGTATSFIYLLITRIFLGGVTAAASPAVASLMGDYFPPRDRANIYGLVLGGELLGTGVGFFIAGEVSSLINWRWAFYVMGGLSVLALWVVWRYLQEPERGGQSWIAIGQENVERDKESDADKDKAAQQQQESGHAAKAQRTIRTAGIEPRRELILDRDPNQRSLWWAMGYLLRIPTYRLLIIASSLGYYFFAGIRGFAMVYLTQHYDVSRSVLSALVIVIGLGALVGVVLGGRLSGLLLDRGYVGARIIIPGVALLASAIFFAPGIWTTNVALGICLLTLGGAALGAANPPIDAARLDIVHPQLWGRGESGRMALRALLEGGAPILFGAMSGWFGGGENGLKWTYLVMLIPLLVASSLAIPAYRSYPRDVATASASVERLRKA